MFRGVDRAKAITWDWEYLSQFDDEQGLIICLTPRQVQALLPLVGNQLSWATRWAGYSNFDDVLAWVADIGDRLMGCEDLCQAIADCINNGGPAAQAVKNVVGGGTPTKTGTGSTENLIENLNCDSETLCGVATAIVDYMAGQIEQWLAEIAAGTDETQQRLAIVRGIPIVGEIVDVIVIADVVEFITELIDAAATSFDAGYAPSMRDDMICGLRDIMCNTCEINIEQISDYFAARIGGTLALGAFAIETLLDLLDIGDATTTQFANWAFAAASFMWRLGLSFNGSDMRSLRTIIATSDPSNDCDALCDDCDTWCHEIDFTASDGDFFADDGFALWGAGGWGNNGVLDETHVCLIRRNFAPTFTATKMVATYSSAPGYQTLLRGGGQFVVDSTPELTITLQPASAWTVDYILVRAQQSASAGTTLTAKITKLRIEGRGYNPFGTSNCGGA